MAEINRVTSTNNGTEYIKSVENQSLQKKIQQQIQKNQDKKVEKDHVSISPEAKQLLRAREIFRKFLEEKAKEIEKNRIEKIKEIKRRLQEKPNLPIQKIAEKIAKEYFGLE